ncbi:MAG: ROK family transcriptional regulator [Anaerolineae bacterium]|nr:ROK family transcriptional regulator [Anaerolineae bacterium]
MTTQLTHPTRSVDKVEANILASIRKSGPLSRAELGDLLGYSRANVTAVLNHLLALNILEERELGESQGGRRPRMYGINGSLGYVVGVDMGATSLDLALADLNGNILERVSEPCDVREEPEILLNRVAELIEEMLGARNGRSEQLLAIGIGVPGPVKFDEGVLVAPPLMPAWESFPIKTFMRQQFTAANVAIDNDVNVMAMGETCAGAGKGIDNFIFLKIGTGIGAGIICHGEIYRGQDGAAGDVGHICIDYNGPVCHCGNVGCLEAMAAGPAIAARGLEAVQSGSSDMLAEALAANEGIMTAKIVGDAAKAGDLAANEIVKSSGRMVGGMLAGLVNFFNPQMILIGGSVSHIGIRYLSAIRQAVLRRSTALSTRHLRIEFSPLGKDAGVIGAIWLALDHVFTIEN